MNELFLSYQSSQITPVSPYLEIFQIKKGVKAAHCMFEHVYFAHPSSKIEGRLVYDVRHKLGENLAREISKRRIDFDYVVPVPDSSRIAAQAIAETLQKPLREAIVKNRYQTSRVFILADLQRKKVIERKYLFVPSLIQNKRILLVDDSIVRGDTSRKLLVRLRKHNARWIGLASTCPPLIRPCYYGIDFSIDEELIARNKSLAELSNLIGADEIFYQGIGDLIDAIGLEEKLCIACITGDYPTPGGRELRRKLSEGKLNPFITHYNQ
ncbi:MAG: amidophosphoribosyltransferase [Candidatus Hodarchaeota archaeon]